MKHEAMPFMVEDTPEHAHNIDHVEKTYGGDGHRPEFEKFKAHSAGHKLHHEHVMGMHKGGSSK